MFLLTFLCHFKPDLTATLQAHISICIAKFYTCGYHFSTKPASSNYNTGNLQFHGMTRKPDCFKPGLTMQIDLHIED